MPRLLVFLVSVSLLSASFSQEESDALPVPSARMQPKEIPKTFAVDSQFHIYGGDGDLQWDAYHVAENTQKALYQTLAQKTKTGVLHVEKGWIPIVIQLTDKFSDGPKSIRGGPRINADNTLSIQLFVDAGAGIDRKLLRSEIVRWLLWDLMLRRVDPATLSSSFTLELPDWLPQGCLELMEYQQRGKPSELFASVFKLGKTLTIDEILNADISGLDSVSMSIYRISSSALILMMLDQPNGLDSLIACIGGLPAMTGGISEHLERYFPVLRGNKNQMEKWWSLQLAAAAEPTTSELYTMLQTEEKLSHALTLAFVDQPAAPAANVAKPAAGKKLFGLFKKSKPAAEPDSTAKPGEPAKPDEAKEPAAQTLPIEEFSKVLGRKDHARIFRRCSDELMQLSLRAHPFYRSLINSYQQVLSKLADGKDRGAADSIAALGKKRQTMLADARSIEDYMDWHEATQRTEVSGKFYDYLRSADMLEKPSAGRTDAITRYLDALEKEYK